VKYVIDEISYRILALYKNGSQPLKSLICEKASSATLFRRRNDLCGEGWLQSDGKGGFKISEQGLIELDKSIGETPRGLSSFYPPLLKIRTEFHLAMVELAIASVIARVNNIRLDKFLALLFLGRTLKWKTSAARFICIMLGLDPDRIIVNVSVEGGKSLTVRKNSIERFLLGENFYNHC
jgi:hypothetical protein